MYVTDGAGNPESGVDIDLAVIDGVGGASGIFGGGPANPEYITVTSGLDGLTNPVSLVANGIEGSWTVEIIPWISFSGDRYFYLTNTAPSGQPVATTIEVAQGGGQKVTANTALPVSLTAQVKDQYGNAAGAGINITATAPASGASGIFATTGTRTMTKATDGAGLVNFGTFTTNATLGAFNISLTGSGLSGATAQITIVASTSEVCTPQSAMSNFTVSAGGWTNPARWFTGAAQSGTYAEITVNGTETPASYIAGFTFDQAQLALIHPDAKITSIECKFWAYVTKDGTYYPGQFEMYPVLATRGSIIRTATNVGTGIATTWVQEGATWTTFQNTGNTPASLLLGKDLKNPDPLTQFQIWLRFKGESSSSTAGRYRANGAYAVVCYINPDAPLPQFISLQLCEV